MQSPSLQLAFLCVQLKTNVSICIMRDLQNVACVICLLDIIEWLKQEFNGLIFKLKPSCKLYACMLIPLMNTAYTRE